MKIIIFFIVALAALAYCACQGKVISYSINVRNLAINCNENGTHSCGSVSYKPSTLSSYPYGGHEGLKKSENKKQIDSIYLDKKGGNDKGKDKDKDRNNKKRWGWSDLEPTFTPAWPANPVPGIPTFGPTGSPVKPHTCAITRLKMLGMSRPFCEYVPNCLTNICQTCGHGCTSITTQTTGSGSADGGGNVAVANSRFPCTLNRQCRDINGVPTNFYNVCYRKCTSGTRSMDCAHCSCEDPDCFNDCTDMCGGSFCRYCTCAEPACREFCNKCIGYTPVCGQCSCTDEFCKAFCSQCNPGYCQTCSCQNDVSCSLCSKCDNLCKTCIQENLCNTEMCYQCEQCIDCTNLNWEKCQEFPYKFCSECANITQPINNSTYCFDQSGNHINCSNSHGSGYTFYTPCVHEQVQCGSCSCNDTSCISACGNCCKENVESGSASCLGDNYYLTESRSVKCNLAGTMDSYVTTVLGSGESACVSSDSSYRALGNRLHTKSHSGIKIEVRDSFITYPLRDGSPIGTDVSVSIDCNCHCPGSPFTTCTKSTDLCNSEPNCMTWVDETSGSEGCLTDYIPLERSDESQTCCKSIVKAGGSAIMFEVGTPTDVITEICVTMNNNTVCQNVSLHGENKFKLNETDINIQIGGYLESFPYPGKDRVVISQGSGYIANEWNSRLQYDVNKGGWVKILPDGTFSFDKNGIKNSAYITTKSCSDDDYEVTWSFEKSQLSELGDFQTRINNYNGKGFNLKRINYDVKSDTKIMMDWNGQIGFMTLAYTSGNPLLVTMNATGTVLEVYYQSVYVSEFSCVGKGDTQSGVNLKCDATVVNPGGTIVVSQYNKDSNDLLHTETVFAGSKSISFEYPIIVTNLNDTKICVSGQTRDLCNLIHYDIESKPVIIPDWTQEINTNRFHVDVGDGEGGFDWWNPFSWFQDDDTLLESIVMVIVSTLICICLVVCCIFCLGGLIYVSPQLIPLLISTYKLLGFLPWIIKFIFKILLRPVNKVKKLLSNNKKYKVVNEDDEEGEIIELEVVDKDIKFKDIESIFKNKLSNELKKFFTLDNEKIIFRNGSFKQNVSYDNFLEIYNDFNKSKVVTGKMLILALK